MVFESTSITSGLPALVVPKIWRLKAASLTVLFGEVFVAGGPAGVITGWLSGWFGIPSITAGFSDM